jgi:methylmalonyl-CoA mutase
MDKVTDVSAGSYYIENLTKSLFEEAWKLFLSIEEKGGFQQAAEKGIIQEAVNAMGDKRRDAVASRRETLLGTNQYPNFGETAMEKMQSDKPACQAASSNAAVPVLNLNREAAAFEALRLATEKSGKRPKVFMLTIGPLNMRLARAQFSCNFFACAGYDVLDNLGFQTIEEGVAAAREAGADIIVLCSSDEEYETLAPQAKKAIGNGHEILVVAGAPACMEACKKKALTILFISGQMCYKH